MSILELRHIRKSFDGQGGLEDISLSVTTGSVTAIIGPSGSGKSTLLRCATLLETADGGDIIYEGKYAAKDGVYAVTGNHEFDAAVNPVREWCAFYAEWGAFLRNGCVFPRAGLALGGVDDESVALPKPGAERYGDAPDVAKAFAYLAEAEFVTGQVLGVSGGYVI